MQEIRQIYTCSLTGVDASKSGGDGAMAAALSNALLRVCHGKKLETWPTHTRLQSG